jgi:general secretion pathway protein A
VARGADAVTFEPAALDLVHAISGGVPRVINLLCDRALMLGADMRVNLVTAALIEDAARRLDLQVPATPDQVRMAQMRKWGTIAAAALLFVAAVLAFAPLDRLVDTTPPRLPAAPVTFSIARNGP